MSASQNNIYKKGTKLCLRSLGPWAALHLSQTEICSRSKYVTLIVTSKDDGNTKACGCTSDDVRWRYPNLFNPFNNLRVL